MRYLSICALMMMIGLLGISTWSVALSQRGDYYGASAQGKWTSPAFREGERQGRWDAEHDRRPNWRNNNWRDEQDVADYQAGYKAAYRGAVMGDRTELGANEGQGIGRGERGDREAGVYRQDMTEPRQDNPGPGSINDQWGNPDSRRQYEFGYYSATQGYDNQGMAGMNREKGDIRIEGRNVTWDAQGVQNARVYLNDNGQEQLFAEGANGTQAASWAQPGRSYLFILRDQNGYELNRAEMRIGR